MSISTAPKQGEGAAEPRKWKSVDKRLWVIGGMGTVTGALLVAAICTLPVMEVEVNGSTLGEVTLWRVDFEETALNAIGTLDETDPETPKAIAVHHSGKNKRHRNINEDLIQGYRYCNASEEAEATCGCLRDMTRLLLQAQGKLLPATSITWASLIALPLTSMRTTNQALAISVVSFIACIVTVAAAINIGVNLEDAITDYIRAAFPGAPVSVSWQYGAIFMFLSAGCTAIYCLNATALTLITRDDPYDPADGPNYDDNNPEPVHFKPMNQRPPRVEGPTEPTSLLPPPPMVDDECNANAVCDSSINNGIEHAPYGTSNSGLMQQ